MPDAPSNRLIATSIVTPNRYRDHFSNAQALIRSLSQPKLHPSRKGRYRRRCRGREQEASKDGEQRHSAQTVHEYLYDRLRLQHPSQLCLPLEVLTYHYRLMANGYKRSRQLVDSAPDPR